MSEETKNIIKVACIYMTTIIGAGFASGQEIVQFFSMYYAGGFYGIMLAGVLFAVIGYKVLDKVHRERIKNYDELLFPTVGWFLGWIMEVVVTLFMFSLFCIMIAGGGSIFADKIGIPLNYGVALMALICAAAIMTDIKGIVAISTVVTPVLILGMLAVGLYVIVSKDTSVFSMTVHLNRITQNWFFSSLIYVSYNSILSVVVMCGLLPYLKTRKTGIVGGMLGGLMLCVIALVLNTVISMFYPGIVARELPVLSIVEEYSVWVGVFYTVILWLAMFISAVTSGYGFIDRVGSKMRINRKLAVLLACAFAIPLSGYGFSSLIKTIYPIFGYAGLFMIFVLLLDGIRLKPAFALAKKFRGGKRR